MQFIELKCRYGKSEEFFEMTFNVLNIIAVYPLLGQSERSCILWKREQRNIFGRKCKKIEIDESYISLIGRLGIKKNSPAFGEFSEIKDR